MARRPNTMLDAIRKTQSSASQTAVKQRPKPPALKTMEATLSSLSERTVKEIDPDEIQQSALSDRLSINADQLRDLTTSIEENGQTVPIIVRPTNGSYEVVAGRRRLAACRKLGILVKCIVHDFNDEDAIIAQGIENNQRADTSFIEKAVFASKIAMLGFSTQVIKAALQANDAAVSKMKSVTTKIPEEVILAIGPANGIGRERWLQLANVIEDTKRPAEDLIALIEPHTASEMRFNKLLSTLSSHHLAKPKNAEAFQELVKNKVTVKRSPSLLAVKLGPKANPRFLDYLGLHLRKIYEDFESEERHSRD